MHKEAGPLQVLQAAAMQASTWPCFTSKSLLTATSTPFQNIVISLQQCTDNDKGSLYLCWFGCLILAEKEAITVVLVDIFR